MYICTERERARTLIRKYRCNSSCLKIKTQDAFSSHRTFLAGLACRAGSAGRGGSRGRVGASLTSSAFSAAGRGLELAGWAGGTVNASVALLDTQKVKMRTAPSR